MPNLDILSALVVAPLVRIVGLFDNDLKIKEIKSYLPKVIYQVIAEMELVPVYPPSFFWFLHCVIVRQEIK